MLRKRSVRDYKFIRVLGEGSFSSVYLAVDADCCDPHNKTTTTNSDACKQPNTEATTTATAIATPDTTTATSSSTTINNTNNLNLSTSSLNTCPRNRKIRKYAIKVCQKSHIKRQNKQTAIMREKEIMNKLNEHPNEHFIKLYCTFQDVNRLFFVMTYAENGELLTHMQEQPLSLSSARRYTYQLVEALEHLHRLGIVHRDLKPENILLNENMDILITDFGSAQIYSTACNSDTSASDSNTHDITRTSCNPKQQQETKQQDRRNSFVGTAQYVSPEMLKDRQASHKSDLWALGVIIYQMITNVMPFNAPNEYLIYQKILSLDYQVPEDFDENALDLVKSLLRLEPSERLGANDDLKNEGYVSLRRHKFLKDEISANRIAERRIKENPVDPELKDIDKISPGLDESQLLRLLTDG